MRRPGTRRRPGITLLEMILTTTIAMLVLLALFMVMRSQYNHAQAGRDALTDATLARSILTRMSNDIVNSLGPVDPRFLPYSILPNNANMSAKSAGNSGNTGNTSGGTTSSGTTSGGTTTSTTPISSSTTASVPFNVNVKGGDTWLILSINRPPAALMLSSKVPIADNTMVSSDLRCLCFWLAEGNGLARLEMSNVPSDSMPTTQDSLPFDKKYVIAAEVQGLKFQYYDGAEWVDDWDGGRLGGADGNTPIGPPAAIAITITMNSGPPNPETSEQLTVSYKHVVALPASNAFTQAGPSSTGGTTLQDALMSGQQQPGNMQNNPSGSSSSSGM